jgi:transposase
MLATLLSVMPKARRHGLRLLVTPDTILRWHRSIIRRRWAARSMRGKTGRPATRQNIKALVLRLAPREPRMGYRRIHSELASLEVKVAASTAWEILKNAGIDPAPRTVVPRRLSPPAGTLADSIGGSGRGQQGTTGLTRCADGKSHPPKALRTGTGASVQGSGERNVLPGQSASSPSWRAASADRASSPRLMPEPAPGCWTGSSCCCAAVFCCCTRASNAGSGFRNYLF